MSGDHEHYHGGFNGTLEISSLDPLVIPKQGDAYYPDSPAFYVGGDIYTLIADVEDTGRAFEFLDFYIPDKTLDIGVPQHTHANEGEAKYILEGEVSFFFGEGTVTAPAGTFVYYPGGRPMGFLTTDQASRLAVHLVPGGRYYEQAGVPVDVPPPEADFLQLQQQVDFDTVIEVNDTYGGSFYVPGVTTVPSEVPDITLVVPNLDDLDPSELAALETVEGLSIFELSDRATFLGQFGEQHISLVDFEETQGRFAYSQFTLDPQEETETVLRADLSGAQVLEQTNSSATGIAVLELNPTGDALRYSIHIQGLDLGAFSPGGTPQTEETSDDVTAIQFHNAPPGENGGIAFNIVNPSQDDDLNVTINPDGSATVSGIWEENEPLAPPLALSTFNLQNAQLGQTINLYINVHTETFPNGEIRGQVKATKESFGELTSSPDHQTLYVKSGELAIEFADRSAIASADTFIYIPPNEDYTISNFSNETVEVLAAMVENSYVPKVGEYIDDIYTDIYPDYENEFTASVLENGEYTQGNVISIEPMQIGDDPASWIYTWGAFTANDSPLSLGISFTESSLDDIFQTTDPDGAFPRLVPHLATRDHHPPIGDNEFEVARVYDLSYPDQVVAMTPFEHMGFYANQEGHAPEGVYSKPHLDVHFFNISQEERSQIQGSPAGLHGGSNTEYADLPPDGFLPDKYILFTTNSNPLPAGAEIDPFAPDAPIPATADIEQGLHWVPNDAPELTGGAAVWEQTFIFGSYDNKVNFWEPMITREFLESLGTPEDGFKETDVRHFTIPQPERFQENSYYPLSYTIGYSADHNEYFVSLDELTLQEANAQLLFGTPNPDDTALSPDLVPNGDDIVFAGAGDDIIDVSPISFGNNRIYTGTGADEVTVGNKDRAFGGIGKDIMEGSLSSGARLYGGDDDDEMIAGANSRLFGGNGNDTLDATPGTGGNRLYGGAGNDYLKAGSDDILIGGEGDDLLIAGSGGAVLQGGNGLDTFVLTEGEAPSSLNIIADFDPNHEVLVVGGLGLSIADLTFTPDGNDTLITITATGVQLARLQNVQANQLNESNFNFSGSVTPGAGSGGSNIGGTPTQAPSQPLLLIADASGNQTLTASLGGDTLYANTGGGNTLNGSNGNDVLYAGLNGDTLNGDAGEDILVAGQGDDTLRGGSGYDYFVFQKEHSVTENGIDLIQGGYGGSDIITDFEAIAGVGDILKLRNLDVNTQIDIVNDGQGNTLVILSNLYVDPETGLVQNNLQNPSGPVINQQTGAVEALPGNTFQTITIQGINAQEFISQAQIEVNGLDLNEGTPGIVQAFGTYRYTIGSLNTNFPDREGGVTGSLVLGDPLFGRVPDVPLENNLVMGSFINDEEVATILKKIVTAFPNGITIPGTEAEIPPELRAELEARKIIGEIPEALLPQNVFGFAIDANGDIDLSQFTRTFDPSTINDDTIIGGPGNDFIIGGPGNDTIVGGYGTDLILGGVGQDLIIGREGLDYIVFDSILDIRDRDIPPADQASNAYADARLGYIREEEPYGDPNTVIDPLTGQEVENPFSSRTGPDIILVNSEAFNRGIGPDDPLADVIGYLKPGTIITGNGSGPAATKNGQLNVGTGTVPLVNGPAEDDLQPTFYYNPTSARLFFDRDGIGTGFFDFWMADMGAGALGFPEGTPDAAPAVIIAVY